MDARFWTQALSWKVLSERENEIVIGTDENAPAGLCFMPGHRSQDGQEPRASRPHQQRRGPRSGDRPPPGARGAGSTSGRPALSPGPSVPIPRETSSASCARRKPSV